MVVQNTLHSYIKILPVTKFGGFAPNDVFRTIGGIILFDGMVRMHAETSLADFNSAVERHTGMVNCQILFSAAFSGYMVWEKPDPGVRLRPYNMANMNANSSA